MNQELLKKIEADSLRKEPLNFSVGDTVKVHVRVVEGD
ncbi:MAG TPA: 50S ribosomal protein L19, partial [Verrucomicrobiales bacterium]|nr:50S ribosomal protein L19 [Verrucomicrobiales bacterium]